MTTTIDALPGPRRLPGLGNAHQLKTENLHLILERWARQYGPVYRIGIGPTPVVIISDRDASNAILRQRPDGYRRWRAISEILVEMGVDGVFGAEGDAWRRQRRLSVTALNADYLNRYYDAIARAVGRLHGRLQAQAARGEHVNIHPLFQAFTVEVTTALAFGKDVDADDGDDLLRHIQRMFDGLARRLNAPAPYWRAVRLPADRALERSVASVNTFLAPLIAQARRRMAEDAGRAPANFLEGMLAAPDRFNDGEIIGNAITMLMAGEDTTAHSLGWAAWYAAKRPDVQERLRAEAIEVLGTSPVPDYAATTRLTYAEAVVREAVRLRSAASVLFLEPCEDATILDVAVPAGTRLILLTRHIAVQEGAFDRPKSFDPDRWLTGADHKAHLAFGAGPRVCPGRNLAYLEAKSALAMLAYAFELSPDPAAARPRERFGFSTGPTGVPVLLRERVRPSVASGSPAA